MGTDWQRALSGVSNDMFNPPKANLMINIHLPTHVTLKLDESATKYKVNNKYSAASLFETNKQIYQSYGSKSIVLDFEREDQELSLSTKGVEIFKHVASDVSAMHERLHRNDVFLSSYKSLKVDENAAYFSFAGEFQVIWDILQSLEANKKSVNDNAADSYLLSFTSVDQLAKKYGEDSPQVHEAVRILETYLPVFIKRMNDVYNGELLAEVYLSGPVKHSFNKVVSRRRRDTSDVAAPVAAKPDNLETPNDEDHTAGLNIAVWTSVVLILATVFIVYAMLNSDMGNDNALYRITGTRMKSE